MIGIVSGIVEFVDESKVLVHTPSGIGYEVNYAYATSGVGSEIKIYTSFIVRENSNDLFGFETLEQKNLFSLLLGVKGVGPKSAYSLVSALGVRALFDAILFENKKVIKQAPGIGQKAAAQIILDLKDKVGHEMVAGSINTNRATTVETPNVNRNTLNDALSALSELGYKESDVLGPINKILSENNSIGSDELVKEVLRGSM